MKINLKWIVLLETILIILLSVIMVSLLEKHAAASNQSSTNATSGLLSPSVEAGIVNSKSFLIFNFNSLQDHLYQVFENNSLDVSMYVQNLRNGNNFAINGDMGAFPASLNKIPVATLVLNRIEKGELSYDTPVKIDKTLLDNSSDQIYFKNDQLPVGQLLEKMLKESDNVAFYLLLTKVNITDLNNLMTYFDVDAEHSYNYSSESDMEHNALLTPQSFSNMFLSLYYSTVLDSKDSEYMLRLLANTTMNMTEIANIPNNVIVAHKWGYHDGTDGSSTFNDCGIMYMNIGNGRILYCITIRNQDASHSLGILGGVVNNIYIYYTGQRQTLDEFRHYLTANTK
jgi:beta-lactamase class A